MRRPEIRRGAAAFGRAMQAPRIPSLRKRLLAWEAEHGRDFYWRKSNPTPYSVLVAESLLAKTRAELVEPIAIALLRKYPQPGKLAAARPAELRRLLRPLGLHRKRSQQLIACAQSLAHDHGGSLPSDVAELAALPSIGRYAANSIALVAFGQRTAVVDANVVRVFRRVFSLPRPPDRLSVAHHYWDLANRLLPARKPALFVWGLLDLGSMICVPRSPRCEECPLQLCCDFARNTQKKRK